MMPLRSQIRTFIDAAENLLRPTTPASTLNWDEQDVMRRYLRDLDAMVLKDAKALGAI